jgi:biotin transport system ATP-binding protein
MASRSARRFPERCTSDHFRMIRLDNVRHRFAGHLVLDGITLALEERRVAIAGANGSGKSTLVRLLNGLVIPDEGRVTVDGEDVRTDPKAVRRRVGFVFQNPDNQIVYPIVEEDLAFGLRGQRLDKAETARRVTAILARFGLENLRERPAHKLSGGEKQLLAIAGVLVAGPRVLVLDEPTTLLDLRNRRRVIDAVASLEERVIAVSHDLDWLESFDRVIVMDGGRIVRDAPPADALPFYRALMDA